MNNMNFLEQFSANIKRGSGTEFTLDTETAAVELLKDSEAYAGLGIKILSICGGLLGTFFFLGFIAMAVLGSSIATLVFGILTLAGAIIIDKQSNHTILDAVSIGAFLSGVSLIGYAFSHLVDVENVTICVLIIIGLLTIVFSENYMLNFFSVLIINGCLFAFIEINKINSLYHLITACFVVELAVVYLTECFALSRSKNLNVRYAPFRLGSLISFISLLIFLSINFKHPQVPVRWVSAIILIVANVYSIFYVIRFLNLQTNQVLIYIFALLVLASVIFAPSICGAILILILGVHVGHRLTVIAGVLSLIYFVGQFYYDLQYTLLIKSILMMCTGVLLLLACFIYNKING